MIRTLCSTRVAAAVAVLCLVPALGFAQSLVLDPPSASLVAIPATSSDVLAPSGPLPAGPPPVIGLPNTELGLLPGDVIDAITFLDDAVPLGPATLYFSVDRASVGAGVVGPPDVTGEAAAFVPPLTQGEASGDLFITNDPLGCPPLPFNHQIVDGNGALIGPPSVCGYGGGGATYGFGFTELLPTPPVTFNDDLTAFDWGEAGRGRIFCVFLSLAPGSPTLTPAGNPLLPLGAEPGDVLAACPGASPLDPPFLGIALSVTAIPLLSGGPGCAPPACDDIDALAGFGAFSLSPASPSVTGGPMFSPADVIGFGPAIVLAAGGMGLVPADNIDALESSINPCPMAPGGDVPDFDGVAPGPGCDNCPGTFNPGQEDTDGDTIGDVCDPCTDTDVDGFGNPDFAANLCPVDLCPFNAGLNADPDADGRADECDNCPLTANTNQANADFDLDGDVCDLCPNVPAVVPAAMTSAKKAQLGFKNNGPGTSDDSAKVDGVFTTGTAFDPDSTDTVRVTVVNTSNGATLASATLANGAPWVQSNPAKLAWKYQVAGPPLVKAQIKESPNASTNFKWKLQLKTTNLPGPQIAPATDDMRVVIEITPANLCFNFTHATCTSTALKKDQCKP